MLELDAFSEDRHFMVMMLQSLRSHQQGLATAGLSGAAVGAAALGGRRRRAQKLNRKRKRRVSGEETINRLHLLWSVLKRALKVYLHFVF